MKDYIHKEFPKTCASDDFMGQVKRTIAGKPIPQEQIDMITSSIRNNLKLNTNDILLDLCCGNGALSEIFHREIKAYLGVDFSEYLIEVAKKNFEKLPNFSFILSDAFEYVKNETQPERFTKCLCYGAFQYLPHNNATEILKYLCNNFINIESVYIGNLPDKNRAESFFYKDIDYKNILNDNNSAIGIWRSVSEMEELANISGWKAEIINMPASFYSSHYRYDVKLTRK
ncbi:MAG: methyltransferase domain-containing protein [Rickettsiales bacterium]|nr:methyltransferase domain-containing protein [Rickettsiales bacterium]